jgi:hypothetical protein
MSTTSPSLRRWWDLPRRRTGTAWERLDPAVDDRRPPVARTPAPARPIASVAPHAHRTWRRLSGVVVGVVGVVFLGDLAS